MRYGSVFQHDAGHIGIACYYFKPTSGTPSDTAMKWFFNHGPANMNNRTNGLAQQSGLRFLLPAEFVQGEP